MTLTSINTASSVYSRAMPRRSAVALFGVPFCRPEPGVFSLPFGRPRVGFVDGPTLGFAVADAIDNELLVFHVLHQARVERVLGARDHDEAAHPTVRPHRW